MKTFIEFLSEVQIDPEDMDINTARRLANANLAATRNKERTAGQTPGVEGQLLRQIAKNERENIILRKRVAEIREKQRKQQEQQNQQQQNQQQVQQQVQQPQQNQAPQNAQPANQQATLPGSFRP